MARLAALLLLLGGCATVSAPRPNDFSASFGTGTLASQGMASAELIDFTTWVRDHPFPLFSILISRHGKLVYELYTSGGRDEAHYLMSVTKSFLSALVGILIDRRLVAGPAATIGDLLPPALFAGDAERDRFRKLSLEQVLGMAGLDAPDPPRDRTPEALARYHRFWSAPNRVAAALTQPILTAPFQYNDSTPALASGVVHYRSGKSALAFAEESLFGPMGFRNYEWMHPDPTGIENGGYGLRLRPIDMQKFGVLYLDRGMWNGRRLISAEWIDRSFQPWNRSKPELERPDYGRFWWASYFGDGWTAHVANGWKGQRIVVIPEQGLVITMTGCIEDGSETEFLKQLVVKVVRPAVEHGPDRDAEGQRKLDALLAEVRRGRARLGDFIEYRMVPSVERKQR